MVDIKNIAKKAKSRAYDSNLEALALFQILSNIGGNFGLIIRHAIKEYEEIEIGDNESETYHYLSWLPNTMYTWLVNASRNELVKASFITNEQSRHWHIVADSAKRVVIESKVRRWVKTEEGKRFIKRNEHRNDCITTFHWR